MLGCWGRPTFVLVTGEVEGGHPEDIVQGILLLHIVQHEAGSVVDLGGRHGGVHGMVPQPRVGVRLYDSHVEMTIVFAGEDEEELHTLPRIVRYRI